MSNTELLKSIYECILDLSTEDGINASGKEDVYGCIFGRDSAITIIKILNAISRKKEVSYIDTEILQKICRKGLLTLTQLQGKETNIESGEEPGKFIHEYRTEKYERLLTLEKPWFVYPDGILRNYDSLDSTPLSLIALYKYWQLTGDSEFILQVLPAVEAGLNWIISYGDLDKDILLEYELPEIRQHGGLPVQSWTDSHQSMLDKEGKFPHYPIAPVEVQGYAWLALRMWADFYQDTSVTLSQSTTFAERLRSHADLLKKRFNEAFLIKNDGLSFAAQALDGYKNQITTITGNPLLLLWATYKNGNQREAILEDTYVDDFVKRAFQDDMFDAECGIRTMSTKSPTYVPGRNSYHNGSFWPKLNGMIHEGLLNWHYQQEAEKLQNATLHSIKYFGGPIELYVKMEDGTLLPYLNELGQESCKEQAWSAAAALDLLTL